MADLSVVIITYNEEENIGRCLASIQDVADEIIVVDSISQDKTKEICLQYGVTFYEQEFLGYIEQKNYALSKATKNYVLCLDADEALSEKLKGVIIQEKKEDFPSEAYSMNRLSFYCGTWLKHGTFYPDIKLRLFKQSIGKWGGTNPHDKIIIAEGTAVKHINADILHYPYKTYEDHRKQTDRFSTIAAQALYERGSKAGFLNMVINPAWRFINEYILRFGFLDGKNGFMVAYFSARLAFNKYRKLVALKKTNQH